MNSKVKLGRTKLEVTRASFGGIPVGRDHLTDEEGADLIRRVVDEGITLIDTFCNYGRSEERIGMALEGGRREQVTLVTKSRSNLAPDEFVAQIEASLKTMRVERIDVLLLKNVDDETRVEQVSPLVEELRRLQEQGKVGFTGLSSHNPVSSLDAIRTGLIDVAEVPYNFANRHFEPVLDLAAKMDVGILAMKPLAGGRLFDGMEKGAPETLETLVKALSFAISHPCKPVLIPGIGTTAELDRYLEAIPRLKEMNEMEKDELTKQAHDLGDDFCRACGYCRSVCPHGVPADEIIPMLDRANKVVADPTYKQVLRRQYAELMESAPQCDECRKCVEECPFHIDVPERLKTAGEALGH